ncbi:MAG TPA: winged helix-turn-helix transcriptional regulator [Thermoplasmata archaeon]|nr:winged helix-turn-helix transcriptional regulator [Thermoplasmata archaeon]
MKFNTSLFFGILLFAGAMFFFAVVISANYDHAEEGSCAGSGCHREVSEDEHLTRITLLPEVVNNEDDRWTVLVVVEEWNATNSDWEKTERPIGGKLVTENETLDIQFKNETGKKHLRLVVPEEYRKEGNYTIYAGLKLDSELLFMKKVFYFPTVPARPEARVYVYEEGKEKKKSVTTYINRYGRAEVVIDGSESFDLDKADQTNLSFQWEINGKKLSTTEPVFHHVFTRCGSYIINLTVTDSYGLKDKDSAVVSVVEKVYKPDLAVEMFAVSPEEVYPGEDISVSLKVTNKGNLEAKSFFVKIYDTHQEVRKLFRTLYIGELRENTTKSYHLLLQGEGVGVHFLEVRVDPDTNGSGRVEEFDETNNDASLTYVVKAVPVANPLIDSVSFEGNETLEMGQEIVFSVHLVNHAEVESEKLRLKLFVNKVPLQTVYVEPFKGECWVELSWMPDRVGENLVEISLQSLSEVKDVESYNFEVKEKEKAEDGTGDESVPGSLITPAGAAVSLSLIGAVITLYGFKNYEGFKYGILSSLLPLYTRIKKEDTLKHSLREELYQYIVNNPGKNYITIKKELQLKNGTLIYHLKTLENQRFIKSIKDGRYRRFYPRGMKIKKERNTLTAIQQRIVELLEKNPGMSQSRIAEVLGQSRQTINYQIGKLKKNKIVEVERRGITTKCYLNSNFKNT